MMKKIGGKKNVFKSSNKPRKKKHAALFLACVLTIGGFPVGAAKASVYAADTEQALITTSGGTTSYDVVDGGTPTGVVIDPEVLILNSPDTANLDAATVMIENFQTGDTLSYTLAAGITAKRNTPDNGVLMFTGKASAEAYTQTLSSVKFSTTSSDKSVRTIKFTLGDALPYEGNGHFYKYVNKGSSITWDKAKQEAEGMTYFGRQGYLVTITDAKENEFVKEKTLGLGWIGAQDIERKDGGPRKTGDWRWVTGPEGEKDSGNGLKFYEGYYQTSGKPVDGAYTNWDAQEPNDYSNKEYVAHIFSSGQQAGKWNDYPNDNNVTGYVIEFGGMSTDTNYEVIAEKSVAFVNITELKKAVEQLSQLKEEDYMEDEWPAYQQALEQAKAVLENRNKTQEQVNKALEALKAAEDQLKTRIKITQPAGSSAYVAKPEFKGESAPGADVTVEIKDKDGNVIGTPTVKVNADGTWSFKPAQDLADGDYVVEVTATKNGESNTATKNVTVDTTKPQLAITEPTGELVSVAKPEVKGIADPDAKVTVELKDENGNVIESREVEVDSNGNWSFIPTAELADGKYTVDVTAVKDGKVSNESKTIVVDASENSHLIGLELNNSNDGTPIGLSPEFAENTREYTASVSAATYSVYLTPTLDELAGLDPNAKIEISLNGGTWMDAADGKASDHLLLKEGSNTIEVKVTVNGRETIYKLTVYRAFSGGGDNNNGGGNGGGGSTPGTTPTPQPETPKSNLDVRVDGNDNPFATGTTTVTDGRTVTSVKVDQGKLVDAISKSTDPKLAIHSPNEGDLTVGGLTADNLKQLGDKGASLEISNPLAIYPVPAGKMNLSSVAGQLGNAALGDIVVRIDIKRASEAVTASAKSKATSAGYELLVDPIDLDLTFAHEGKNVRSGQLSGYAAKYIALPEGIDPNRITTGVVVNPDGSVYHLPTVVTKINNRYFAQINDLRSSGTYSIIWNPQDFDDVRTHWGKADVNNIAARLDLKGNGNNTFSPDRSVTRSEFAEMVVLGLGLMRPEAPQMRFPDVPATIWYRNAIAIADEFDIVRGYDDGNFVGGRQITREEGFAMVARAHRLILSQNAVEQDTSVLAQYRDGDNVAKWAKADVAQLISAGIIRGNGPDHLSPKAQMTRVEVTALIARMLKVTNLIDK
ncbi:S-layer homology domain-containing protein [Paenibacillus sp. FSL R5-0810]|uniref:S-layer homology domain-containing protein n=1 Tax=Paenibacillus sp. FSL R5-0810 TaxID=2921659 RepID=UPI0030FB4815